MGNFVRKFLPFLLSLAGTVLTFIFKDKNTDEANERALTKWMEKHHPEL